MDPDREYYSAYFPAAQVVKFLQRHSTRPPEYREFALRWFINNRPSWQRFNAFATPQQLVDNVVRRRPIGLYVGPAYNYDPTYRGLFTTARMRPVEQKLIFDIDLTDYDDIRRCSCVGKTTGLRCCSTCWTLAACAIIILRNLLRYKFGFHEFMFTFSGSKGAHCWVLDQAALSWPDSARLSLSAYFRPFVREFTQAAPLQSCPVLLQCYEQVIRPLFIQHIVGQVVDFSSAHGRNLVASCATAHGFTELGFLDQLPPIPDPRRFWCHIEAELLQRNGAPVVRSVIMMCTFPRLDKDITTSMQHLIRCPFSINGARGKLCVPIRYHNALDFDPAAAPDSKSVSIDTLQPYLEVLDEALVAPWTQLWVCRLCEQPSGKAWKTSRLDVSKFNAGCIFLRQDEFETHQEQRHQRKGLAASSTAKALAREIYDRPTVAQKHRVFATLLEIKHRR